MTREEAVEVLKDRYLTCVGIGLDNHANRVNEAIDMAIEALQTEVVRCKDCIQKHIGGSVTQYYWCDFWDREIDCNNGCSWGERKVKKPCDSLLKEDSYGCKEHERKLEPRGDLISRADAIEAMCEECEWERKCHEECQHIETLKSRPSAKALTSQSLAEPNNDLRGSDLISREDALKKWDDLSERGRTEFDQVLMTLPSADRPTGDLISREDALRELNGACSTWQDDSKVADIVSAMPSASDLISRDDAICEVLVNDGIDNIVDRINALPTADRAKGEWVVYTDGSCGGITLSCSRCGEEFNFDDVDEALDYKEYAKFCLHCGSKMEKGDNDE